MEMVASLDGTQIAVWSSGSGPPLVLVHGAMADHTRWTNVLGAFEEHFTVFAIDRRGRGESTDGSGPYAIEREYEDVVAVLEFVGAPSAVLGHSYGATCALGAALLTDQIARLVLYEPGILEGRSGYYTTEAVTAVLSQIEALLAADEREAALETVFREIIQMPEQEIGMVKSEPAWPGRVAAAHTVLRELRTEGAWVFNPGNYAELTVPTLLLTGSESVQITKDGTAALHEALPNSRIVVLEGQGHVAITTAPELFARAVITFLTEA